VTFASALTKHTDEDKLVKVSANGTVALCAENDRFHGIVRVIDGQDKAASVQEDGYVTMDFDPAHDDPALGYDGLVCGVTPNLVKQEDNAAGVVLYKIVSVDSAGHKVTFLLH
jgi:hypothetical protein